MIISSQFTTQSCESKNISPSEGHNFVEGLKNSRIFNHQNEFDLLKELSIKNFALIEDVELKLNDNLTIITGETGAGKSILLGALSLLLGKRADLSTIKDPSQKCIIEGVFSIKNYNLNALFKEQDLDYEPQTIVRREILPSGKSRAFVNDTPVNLSQLSALGEHLVDIHSQHETLFIGDSNYQYRVLDALAQNQSLLKDYKEQLKAYTSLVKALEELQNKQQEAQKTYDYHVFLLNELLESKLTPGKQEELEERQQELANVEELKENLDYSLQQLQQDELGIHDRLQEVKKRLERLAKYGNNYKEIGQRMTSVLLELNDLIIEIERLSENVEDNPQALETIDKKLKDLYNLQHKHKASSIEELIEIQTDLEEKVATWENAAQDTSRLQAKLESCRIKTEKKAKELTKRRKEVIPVFLNAIKESLSKLGMPNATLKIDIHPCSSFNAHGIDEMVWLLSANKGGQFQELKKSASGGELSRIALVIKSILAKFSKLPTLIFDEIDTGVSGEIAQKMGAIMYEMGSNLQVISISHLPQIAAKGVHHFKVYKEIHNGQTRTLIAELGPKERLQEIAEMLGGKDPSHSALAHAKTLLD